MALCGQSEDHAVTSCDPQQQPGFKRDLKNNKSQSRKNAPIGGRWWWSPWSVWEAPSPWRTHLPSESAVTKDGGHGHQHQEQHLEGFFEENKHH